MSSHNFLNEQISYMNDHAEFALNYHLHNIVDANNRRISVSRKMKSNYRKILHNEIISYLNWLGRIRFFSKNMKEKDYLQNNEFKDDFRVFRNKLSAHRAIDDPQDESFVNLEVSANFGRALTFHEEQPYIQLIDYDGDVVTFNPTQDHDKYIKSLNTILREINNNLTD